MLVVAAFCPPDDLVDELCAAIADADDARGAPVAGRDPGAHKRRFRRANTPVVEPAPNIPFVGPWLEPIIPVVRFGNLTSADSRRVAEMLAEVSPGWVPPRVHFAGVRFGTKDRPRSIQATLGGEVSELGDIARSVTAHAAELDFYLDRRLFGASLEIAAATDAATADDLTALTASLADFHGATWTVDRLSVLKSNFGDGSSTFIEEFAIPIGQA